MRKKTGIADVNDICKHFGVNASTVVTWRRGREMPWHSRKRPGEYGVRRQIYFRWKEVLIWARVYHIKVAKIRLAKERVMTE